MLFGAQIATVVAGEDSAESEGGLLELNDGPDNAEDGFPGSNDLSGNA